MSELPERVTVYEVGPRDGLQNEKGIVAVEDKAVFVDLAYPDFGDKKSFDITPYDCALPPVAAVTLPTN